MKAVYPVFFTQTEEAVLVKYQILKFLLKEKICRMLLKWQEMQ